jgi:zinc transporter
MIRDPVAPIHPEAPWSLVLDAKGGALPAPFASASLAAASQFIWIHLPLEESTPSWLNRIEDLPPAARDYFIQPTEYARLVTAGDGLLMTLRGLEQDSGSATVEFPAIRVWLESHRLITAATTTPAAIKELHADLQLGVGPEGHADFLGRLALLLIRDLGALLDEKSITLDLMESRILNHETDHLGPDLNAVRLLMLRINRHIAPQRTLLHELLQQDGRYRLGSEETRAKLQQASERVDDRLERLAGLREHCRDLQEAVVDQQSQQMNNALYLLSLYTALFLPMGVLTGLLGINVAGIPGDKSPWGFWIVCLLLVVFGVAGYAMFKKLGLTRPMSNKSVDPT